MLSAGNVHSTELRFEPKQLKKTAYGQAIFGIYSLKLENSQIIKMTFADRSISYLVSGTDRQT